MHRISVRSLYDFSTEKSLQAALAKEGMVTDLRLRRVYWLVETSAGFAKEFKLQTLMDKIFFDPIAEEAQHDFPEFNEEATYAEVRFLAGVTDNLARSATEALMLFSSQHNTSWQDFPLQVHSGWEVEIHGDVSQKHIEKVLFQSLANPLLNKVDIQRGKDLKQKNTWQNFSQFWKSAALENRTLQLFALDVAVLNKINQERGLALNDEEIQTIIQHFSSPEMQASRAAKGWAGKI
ncbi:MAG TPA: phosphoribosylformylglycinamidine synthase, partial [Bdellovibrio sp.]